MHPRAAASVARWTRGGLHRTQLWPICAVTGLALVGLAWIEGKIDSFGGGGLTSYGWFFRGIVVGERPRGRRAWVELGAPPPWRLKHRGTEREERHRETRAGKGKKGLEQTRDHRERGLEESLFKPLLLFFAWANFGLKCACALGFK